MSFAKNNIYDLLNAKNIPFTCTEHRPVYSMEELDALEMPADAVICKNLFLRNSNGKQHFLLTIPAATPIDLKQLATVLGSSRLSFASAERLEKYLRLQSGLVSLFRIYRHPPSSVFIRTIIPPPSGLLSAIYWHCCLNCR